MTENPPSTGIAVPVTKSEARDERNTAMPAKSPVAPQRAAGVRASTLSCRPSICRRARWVRSVSIQPGSTALTWMLSAAQASRAGARELHDAAFARGVSRRKAGAEDRHHRADVDDLAAARLLHGRIDRLRAQEGAGEVGVDDAVPFLEIERVRGLADVDAGIVDEDVDPAELAADALDHARDRGLVGDVGGDRDRLDAAPRELGDRRVRFLLVAPDDRDAGAGVRQPARHAEPDAAIAAGDDRDLAFEIEYSGFIVVFSSLLVAVAGIDPFSVCPARSGSGRSRPAPRRSRPTGVWLIMKLDAGQAITPVP